MLNAVGIDVSKGRSTIAVLQPGGVVLRKPFDVLHKSKDLHELVRYLGSLDGETRIVMESTGRYHEPILNTLSEAGLFVSAVNPHLIRNYGNNTIRKVKTDPADAKKIARYTLDNWASLREYSGMDTTRSELKTLNSQFTFFTKQKVAAKSNLIALLDETYPGANKLFNSPARPDGSEKWVDYVYSFWHVDCVRKGGLKAFTSRYRKFCEHHGYNYQPDKPQEIYLQAKELVPSVPKDPLYKELIQDSIQQLLLASRHAEQLRVRMRELASTLPEYDTVLHMYGVGPSLGPQLIAEIGDISRFSHREALTAYAGVDPGKNDSGDRNQKSVHASKCGPARLRKTLFQIMDVMLKLGPREDDPVSRFLFKKRAEGKPYLVYMTAGANKFLRVYYGKVKECLRNQSDEQS
ncbi:MAG: IS110 family transposase [Bilifractor sp.]|jgi:transposase